MKPRRVWLVVLSAVFVCTILPGVFAQDITTFVVADDGVLLATDVYLPAGDGPWPVILNRTPYEMQRSEFVAYCEDAKEAGYACVVQNQRGFGDSGGGHEFLHVDGADGRATVAWIAEQSWCNGKVGGNGSSANGMTQYSLAPGAPEALRCLAPGNSTPDSFHHWVFQGGALREALIVGSFLSLGEEPVIDLFLDHRLRDDWWDGLQQAITHPELVTVPGLHYGGWYDPNSQGTLDGFATFQDNGGEGARGRQKLIMGPWTHFNSGRMAGSLLYPPNAALDLEVRTLAWLEHWLKAEDSGAEAWPPVWVYLMGAGWSFLGIPEETGVPGNTWVALDRWPPPSRPLNLYLDAHGFLGSGPTAGAEMELFVDPDNPVLTTGGSNLFCDGIGDYPAVRCGPRDQREIEARDDVLVFTTEELTDPLTVMGRITCTLWIRPDTTDLDLAVRLSDVYPTGHSMLVTDGIQRARMRCSDEYECLLTPGEPTEITIDLWSTALVFNRGHQIRISISGSNWPRFEVNPNHGGDLNSVMPGVVARPDLLFGPEYPSRLELPIWTPPPREPAGRGAVNR